MQSKFQILLLGLRLCKLFSSLKSIIIRGSVKKKAVLLGGAHHKEGNSNDIRRILELQISS